jgi:hypothetical protein
MASGKTSFKLAQGYELKTFQGNLALRDGELFDVAAALAKGNGTITTGDEHLIVALDHYEAVTRGTATKTKEA